MPTPFVQGEQGRYQLTHGLVEGGQGVVWAAVGPDGARVAVKLARLGLTAPKSVADEARSMRDLAHQVRGADRWLVPILDTGRGPHGEPFYVMPLFDGTLADLLQESVPLRARLDGLAQAAHAVELLHAASTPDKVFVHRDVKPSNFLVRSRDGKVEVHLADFGGIREAALMADSTQTTILSPHYAPPEQYLPLKAEPDPSMDTFAMAAMLYEGVTCEGPPEASWNSRKWHNDRAQELMRLASRRRSMSAPDMARYEALRALPPRRLLDLHDPIPLLDAEIERLRNRLEDGLRGNVPAGKVEAVVEDAMDTLVPVLTQALHPDPRLRAARATVLRKAATDVHDLVSDAMGRTVWTLDPQTTFKQRFVTADTIFPSPSLEALPSAPTVDVAPASSRSEGDDLTLGPAEPAPAPAPPPARDARPWILAALGVAGVVIVATPWLLRGPGAEAEATTAIVAAPGAEPALASPTPVPAPPEPTTASRLEQGAPSSTAPDPSGGRAASPTPSTPPTAPRTKAASDASTRSPSARDGLVHVAVTLDDEATRELAAETRRQADATAELAAAQREQAQATREATRAAPDRATSSVATIVPVRLTVLVAPPLRWRERDDAEPRSGGAAALTVGRGSSTLLVYNPNGTESKLVFSLQAGGSELRARDSFQHDQTLPVPTDRTLQLIWTPQRGFQ